MAKFLRCSIVAVAISARSYFLVLSPPRSTQAFASTPLSARNAKTRLLAKREKYNPLKTLFSDMASSIVSGVKESVSGGVSPNLDSEIRETLSVSWDEVRSHLESMQTASEGAFRSGLVHGYGPPSPLHAIRLYDSSNSPEDVRVTFFRDSASWCPYCQKVWMALEEKRIPYNITKINMRCYGDKPSTFLRLQPNGNIPVAIIDGVTYGQSNDIMYALEKLFPNHKSLTPENTKKAQDLLMLERSLFSAWMYWLTGNRDAPNYKATFLRMLRQVEDELSASKGGDFFLGRQVTIVDFMFAPFLERMCASLLFYKGFQIRFPPKQTQSTDYPAVNKWFDAMEKLESYQVTKSDYYTHCWDLPPQLGGCTYEEAGERYEEAINGKQSLDGTRGSWDLPLQPHNGGIEPDWSWCGDEKTNCREAVERISFNFENIVSFAARGAGRKGIPPVSAILADPKAIPNEGVKSSVDATLRVVSMAMLDGTERWNAAMTELANLFTREADHGKNVVDSLAYLRDRVGVPRDMRLPAARQLRAHLNWAIHIILTTSDDSLEPRQ